MTHSAWQQAATTHHDRATLLTADHRARNQRGEKHPVEDFLWTYYSMRPRELQRWHPGAGITLEGAAAEREGWKHYSATGPGKADARVDVDHFFERRAQTTNYVEKLLTISLERTPRYGCFGLHEWAMVYRMTPEQLRHSALPLRIGHEATNAVVESHPIGCTHFDAFRFFTPEAVPLNTIEVSRETQHETEQSGCLHAGMDLYKWAAKLGPIIPGDILLDAFVFARDIREVDMRASPYDVTGYFGANGEPLTPIPIESPEGKREYARLQRGFSERGNLIRIRILDAIAAAKRARS